MAAELISHDGLGLWLLLLAFAIAMAVAARHVRRSSARRAFGYAMMIIGGGLAAGFLVLFYVYLGTMPNAPQPSTGNVIPLDNHGARVFITRSQDLLLSLLQIGGVIGMMCGGFICEKSQSRR